MLVVAREHTEDAWRAADTAADRQIVTVARRCRSRGNVTESVRAFGVGMPHTWMIRAGEGGYAIEDFAKGFAAIGWKELGDLSRVTSREAIRALYVQAYPDAKPGRASNAVAMIFKFRSTLQLKDGVVSYDPAKREYLVGSVDSDYFYDPQQIEDLPHLRKIKW